MSTDLLYLTLSAGLTAILWVPYIVARIQAWGLVNAIGYPENPPPVPAWAERLQKVHYNMVENLAPFAALVLVAQATGTSGATTALGAALFFWARLVHAVVYTLGIPWLRTLSFAVSWVGMVIIFFALIG